MSRVTRVVRPASATARSGEDSRTDVRTAPEPAARATPARTAKATPVPDRRRRPTTAARAPAASAPTPSTDEPRYGATRLIVHTAAATGTSRRSIHDHRDVWTPGPPPVTRRPASRARQRSPDRFPAHRRAVGRR